MLHVIKVGAEVDVNDASLLLDNRFSNPVYRFMRCPFRTISIRPRLEIGFEDRLQNELECSSTTRSRIVGMERTRTFLPPSFGISFFRARMGRYVFETSSSRICSRKLSTPLSSMASNVTPSMPGAPLLLLALS